MTSRKVEAYLAAQVRLDTVDADPDATRAERGQAFAEWHASLMVFANPAEHRMVSSGQTYSSGLLWVIADRAVHKPMLVDEFDGDALASSIAWSLGMKPKSRPQGWDRD